MRTLAELLVFALGWFGIMGLIAIICWAVSRWGAKRKTDQNKEPEQEQKEKSSLDE